MSQQQRVSALFPHHNTAFSSRFPCAAPAKSLITHSSALRSAYFTSSASIRVGLRVLPGKFFTTRLWGVHLASLEVRFWRVGRGSQASLPARSKHTTYPSCFPQHTPWCTTSLALSHPQFSCTLQLDLYPVHSITTPVALQGFVEILPVPSRHHRCRTQRACQVRQHSRASTVVLSDIYHGL
jgi:hypothetical protein